MTQSDLPVIPKVTLGRTGIVTTRLGLGTAAWPRQIPYAQVVEMLETCLAVGIRYIDMAPLYMSEDIVGRALQEIALPPDLVLVTKAGSYSRPDPDFGALRQNYGADTIYHSVERSLKRIGVDSLHIVHIHDVSEKHLPQVFAPDGALAALQDLKSQGVVQAIGMGTLSLNVLQAAVDSDAFDVLQIFHTYTLLNTTAKDKLFPSALAKGISILNSAPFSGYILATGAISDARYNYAPASPDVIEATHRLEAICAQKGVDLPAAALAFSYQAPEVDVTVVASGKPERLPGWVRAFDLPLTAADFAEMLAAAGGSYPLRRE
jgi:D-threo-aldose 1-dehydrogenase